MDNYDEYKIGVFIHLFNIKLYNEFRCYIYNLKTVFSDVKVIINLPYIYNKKILNHITTTIKDDFEDSIVIFNENKGVDIYSFLKMIEYTQKKKMYFDFILKIHTKTSCEHWRKKLIEPLVNTDNLVNMKKNIFKNNIGFIASSRYVLKNDNHKYVNNKLGFQYLESSFQKNLDYKYFVGGTMFWINYECVQDLYQNYESMNKYVISKFFRNKPPQQSDNQIIYEYIYERLLSGVLTKDYKNIKINEKNNFIFI